jgi:hypothetical protein
LELLIPTSRGMSVCLSRPFAQLRAVLLREPSEKQERLTNAELATDPGTVGDSGLTEDTGMFGPR